MAGSEADGAEVDARAQDRPAFVQARRQKVITQARRLLERRDYDRIQMRDVAAKAGVATGTLYRYFGSKEHLYAEVLADWGSAVAGLHAGAPSTRTTREIGYPVYAAMDAFERHPQFFAMVLVLQDSQDPDARRLVSEFGDRLEADIADRLEEHGIAHTDAIVYGTMLWSLTHALLTRVVTRGMTFEEARSVVTGLLDLIEMKLPDPPRVPAG